MIFYCIILRMGKGVFKKWVFPLTFGMNFFRSIGTKKIHPSIKQIKPLIVESEIVDSQNHVPIFYFILSGMSTFEIKISFFTCMYNH